MLIDITVFGWFSVRVPPTTDTLPGQAVCPICSCLQFLRCHPGTLCRNGDVAKGHKLLPADRLVKLDPASSGGVPNDRPKRIDYAAPKDDVLPHRWQLSGL